jgi:replication-associated recombination protein RarA
VSDVTNLLWVEKFRPKTLSDCILPTDLSIVFNGMIKEGTIPNMMLYGKAGTGKTTVARALANDLGADSIIINCSEENGIDTLRTKIRNYCSTVSLNGGLKIVILDEFDYSNAQSIQPALRSGCSRNPKAY